MVLHPTLLSCAAIFFLPGVSKKTVLFPVSFKCWLSHVGTKLFFICNFEVENVVEKTMTGQNVDVFLLESKETQVKSLKIVNLNNISTFV